MFEQGGSREKVRGGRIMRRDGRPAREETSVPASHMHTAATAAAALRLPACDDKTGAHSEAHFDLHSLKIERLRLLPGTQVSLVFLGRGGKQIGDALQGDS